MRVPFPPAMHARIVPLDILRFFAVALVVGHHWDQFVGCRSTWAHTLWRRAGWTGVDLFFVLSGFLVSALLFRDYQKRRRVGLGRFLLRRGLKIYPGFYALMAATLALGVAAPSLLPTFTAPRMFAEFAFVQNYARGVYNHTWSLAIEEHFYILLAVTVWLAARRDPSRRDPFRVLAWCAPAVFALCLALRSVAFFRDGYNWWALYAPTHLRIDALLFGVLLSYLVHFHAARFVSFVRAHATSILSAAVPLVVGCLLFEQNSAFMVTAGLSCLSAGFGGIMLVALYAAPPAPRALAGLGSRLAKIGEYSYSIYLWHMPAVFVARALFHRDVGTPLRYISCLALYLLLVFGGGILAAKLIEMPVLRLRDRFFPAGGPVGEPASATAGERAAAASPESPPSASTGA